MKQELQQFYTPHDLARWVIDEAYIAPGMFVLEPSAGRGALAAPTVLAGCEVHCVEVDHRNFQKLCSTPYASVVGDEFSHRSQGCFTTAWR
nr:hypothetical protein NG677_23640 [Methylobacterium sp.]